MGLKPFHFKRFSVAQEHATHKVGTDGVLLAAWVNLREDERHILDIGTGSGVIALMLAQRSRSGVQIDAVEIEASDAEQAMENVARSPWPERISVYHTPIQAFHPERQYDLIVANPPYFENSLSAPEKKRAQARHTTALPFEVLLKCIVRLLSRSGRSALILPYAAGMKFMQLARNYDLFPVRKTFFRSRVDKPVKRILFELAYVDDQPVEETTIVLYDENNAWSEAYKAITRDFYLHA